MNNLGEAEQCAHSAIKHFSGSHNQYTFLGALCYGTGRYAEGDMWFAEAIKRGATLRDQDSEIKRIISKKKGEEQKNLINHLLRKDPVRFAWVKKYVTSGSQ